IDDGSLLTVFIRHVREHLLINRFFEFLPAIFSIPVIIPFHDPLQVVLFRGIFPEQLIHSFHKFHIRSPYSFSSSRNLYRISRSASSCGASHSGCLEPYSLKSGFHTPASSLGYRPFL